MTNTATPPAATDAQIAALIKRYSPGNVEVEEARAAIDAATAALWSDLPLVFAVNAAACTLYAGFATMSLNTRGELMAETMNGLMAADRVRPLSPPWRVGMDVKVEKSKRKR